ncbi:PLG [Mytilus edulis]|uniref:PLG n=1 Tax=Mytilus edulis TaxID=6550 RepID=A0A8S3Q2I5_MYTED|nr:PLG [Mytilus edulis]
MNSIILFSILIVTFVTKCTSLNHNSNVNENGCKKTAKGSEYNGTISTTISNMACQSWKLNSPHRHRFHNLEANYCRNPDGEPAPWSKEKGCKKTAKGSEYKGKISTTISNRACQSWKLNSPHRHRFHNLEANYCRNPDGEPAPWCYTTDPKKRWEICNVPFCTKEEGCKKTAKGSEYKGKISSTISNRACQSWKLNSPHRHRFHNLEANYCRNPDGEPAPWCYTTDPKKRWEICNVPFCTKEKGCKKTAKGSEYKGKISTTISNRACQSWKLNSPHRHRFHNLEANYCRNPDGEPAPWCYTTDPKKRWEICNVPFCTKEKGCKKTAKGSEYNGTISTTISNMACQSWKLNSPHRHRFHNLEANYCRNPDGEPAPWCYTTDPKKRWEICNVPFCIKEKECKKTAKGSEYKGKISSTISNRTCQRWKLNSPHRHRFHNLEANYCRNPDGEPAPWCYTTDPKKRWEICNVPFCN